MKKLLLFFAAAAMAVSFSACSENPDDNGDNTDNGDNSENVGGNTDNIDFDNGCVIYYTTTNDKAFPAAANLFGSGIRMVNTYENGQGTIKLNKKITTFLDAFSSGGDVVRYGERTLKSIVIPDCVTEIAPAAFEHCTGLESITLPDGLTTIGSSAFYFCHNLTNINIPDSVRSIGEYAFNACYNITVYCHPTTPPSLGERAFDDPEDAYYYNENINIYVPRSYVQVYTTAAGWSNFASFIQGFDF